MRIPPSFPHGRIPLPSLLPADPSRRQALRAASALGALAALAGCGGGGAPGGAPPGTLPPGQNPPTQNPPGPNPPGGPANPPAVISKFEADRTEAFIGERVTLTAVFSGGSGEIEPDIGPVSSGVPVSSPVLDRDAAWRLVVQSPQAPAASRQVSVRVRYRDRFQVVSHLPVSQHEAVACDDGTVLIVGGSRGEGVLSTRIDRYHPQRGHFEVAGALSIGRAGHRAVRLPGGQVLVVGGEVSLGDGRLCEQIDERTGAVQPAGATSVRRVDPALALLPGGRVLVVGGVAAGEGNAMGVSASAEIWDPQSRLWRRLNAPMRATRVGHTATVFGEGKVLIVGGYSTTPDAPFAEIFDATTETFTPVGSAFPRPALHAARLTPAGHVMVAGGEHDAGMGGSVRRLTQVLAFDPVGGGFRALPPLLAPRAGAASVPLPGGGMLLLGGRGAQDEPLDSTEFIDPVLGGRSGGQLDRARADLTATWLPGGRVLVVGGENARDGLVASAGLYD